MTITYNYTQRTIFGTGEDIQATAKASKERINLAFRHMKASRNESMSAIIIGDYCFFYQLLSDVEKDKVTVQHRPSRMEVDIHEMSYTKARRLALELLETEE